MKLDAQNEPGVFLEFGHLTSKIGVDSMVKQSFVVTRHNVAFVENFKEKKPSPELHTLGIT